MRTRISTALVAAGVSVGVVPALAQNATEEIEEIEEIVVSGVRTPVAPEQMPTAVTLIDRDAIELRQSFQAVDLLRDVPGISIARTGGVGGQAQLRMRGAEANHVLVIIDGIEVNDPASGDEFQFEHLSTMDIERIEVIRGPQSALWGSDAVAGVIAITTRRPEQGFSVSGTAEGGSFETFRGSANLSAAGEGWYFSGNGGYSDSDGTNIARLGDERDGYRNALFGGTLGLNPAGSSFGLTLTARHTDTRTDTDPVDFFVTGLPVDGDRVTDTRRTYLGAKATFDLMDGRLSQRIGASWIDTNNSSLADGLPDGITAAERLQFSAQSTFLIVEGHRLTAAFDHESTDYVQRGAASFFGDPNQDQELKTTGFVGDYVGEFDNGFTAFASVRHDDNTDFRNKTSWRLGGNYALSDATRLRASVGTGQKAPTVIESFGFFSDLFVGNPDLKPERSTSFEVGIDHDMLEGRVKLGLTYFNARLRDEINGFVFDLNTFLFTAENKPGKSRRQGLEASLEADLGLGLSLSANYTYTDADEEAADGAFTRELRRPRHQGAATLSYRRDDGITGALNIGYTGDADDLFFPPFPLPSRIVTLDGYWLASLAVEVPVTDRVALTARVENAFDSDYEDVFGFRNPGRGAYAGIKIRY